MLTRIIGLIGALYFGVFGCSTWVYIATQPHTWKNYLAAATCTVMFVVGLWLLYSGDSEEKVDA
jgi:hypothetical protein